MADDVLSHDFVERARQIDLKIDSTKAHPARVYDWFLGGKDNYPADREAARASVAASPRGYLDVWHCRDFMRRAVGYLVGETGIRQFLDIGTGLPTQDNVHEIAQRIAPESRIVYVDNDPVVLTHAHALLVSGPAGRTDYVDADLREPAKILREAARTLDFGEPVALVLASILHFVDGQEAYDVVRQLVRALPSGSYMVVSHLTADLNPEKIAKVAKAYSERGFAFVLRSEAEILRFFTDSGLDPIEPGIVPVHRWRPDHASTIGEAMPADEDFVNGLDDLDKIRYHDINDVTEDDINAYGAVAYKP